MQAETDFTASKAIRDERCKAKRKIIVPILKSMKYSKDTYILAMPCLFGDEAYLPIQYGMPAQNLFALERERDTHAEIFNCTRSDRSTLKGIQTTKKPMQASKGIDEAYWTHSTKYDLIYLDYWSRLSYMEHYRNSLLKIFTAKMLKDNGILILTSGRNRCLKEAKAFNTDFLNALGKDITENINEELILAAMQEAKVKSEFKIKTVQYRSKSGNKDLLYTTTILKLKGETK